MNTYQNGRDDLWGQLAGDSQVSSLNHNDFMINAMREFNLDMTAASIYWDSSNKYQPDHLPKEQWMKEQKRVYNGVWRWMEEQSIVVPLEDDGSLPVQMWYFSQNCFSAESYWTALSQDPSTLAADSPISYDSVSWASQLCSSWTLCMGDDN